MPKLDFKGKQFVYAHHLSVPFRELKVDAKKSLPAADAKPDLDDNLIIHGDNLHALKALLPQYAGKIKCIYIDPPYNTGEEGWCYNDNVRGPLIQEWLKESANPVDKEDLERHDKWLCMMWPRLSLLKELLSVDGKIFISIDDNAYANLKCMMDEVFSDENFLCTFVWRRRSGAMDAVNNVSTDHDYILCYGNKKDENLLKGDTRTFENYTNPDKDPRGPWYADNLSAGKPGGDTHYAIKDPKTGHEYWPPKGRYWPYNPKTMQRKIEEGRIIFPNSPTGSPLLKRFKEEAKSFVKPISTWINSASEKLAETDHDKVINLETHLNSQGTKLIKEIFGDKIFNYPKPLSLIKSILEQCTEDGDIILDSFSGTGTTGHAVLALNHEDGGNRKFILVECEDYANEVTAERIRRVSRGVPNATDKYLKSGLGGSFTFCTLGQEINIDSLLKGGDLPDYEALARYVFYTATGKTLDKVSKPTADWFIGETEMYNVHLIYKPDVEFLRGNESALNADLVTKIQTRGKGKKSLVFATAKFMGQKELSAANIDFCQLPYAIHRILGE